MYFTCQNFHFTIQRKTDLPCRFWCNEISTENVLCSSFFFQRVLIFFLESFYPPQRLQLVVFANYLWLSFSFFLFTGKCSYTSLILLLFQQGITFSLRRRAGLKAQKPGLLVRKFLLRLESVFSSGTTCMGAALAS